MDIIKTVADTLDTISKRGITCVEGWYDANMNDTHVTYYEFKDNDNAVSDDETEEILHTIHLDIWSKSDEMALKNEIKSLMKADGFGYVDGQDLFEIDTKIYHKAMLFYYIESEE